MAKWKNYRLQKEHLRRVGAQEKQYTPELLVAYLIDYILKRQKVPTAAEFRTERGYPDLAHYYFFFGGWRNVIEMIGERSRKYDTKKTHVKTSDGYWVRKDGGRYVREHRLIMQSSIGRLLKRDEVVHHINGDRADNRLSNLCLMTNAEHTRIHHAKHCA